MAKREDGKETRSKVLDSACEVFARKGYRAATVADICKRAGANVASVNYYFGDKASLYREAWRFALESFQEHVVIDTQAESPKQALRNYIFTLMRNFSSKGEIGLFSRLYLRELVSPTGLIQDAWHDLIEPRRQVFHSMIRKIIGEGADELSIRFCEQSIINQCRVLLTIKREDLEYMLGEPLTPDLIRRFAVHTADFSLAGIEALRRAGARNESVGGSRQ
ncbi:MAG: TetR/AcrR family transcriptional regulator [Desulfobacterales bacterium]